MLTYIQRKSPRAVSHFHCDNSHLFDVAATFVERSSVDDLERDLVTTPEASELLS